MYSIIIALTCIVHVYHYTDTLYTVLVYCNGYMCASYMYAITITCTLADVQCVEV